MELKYTKIGDYKLPNLTLNDNKKGTINKYGMLRLDYLKAHKKALYTTLLMKDELTNHLISVSKDAEDLLNNLMESYKNSKIKEEIKTNIDKYIIEKILKALEENINCLIKVKNKFHYLGYFENEQAIGTKIENLKIQNSEIKEYLLSIINDKDNAN